MFAASHLKEVLEIGPSEVRLDHFQIHRSREISQLVVGALDHQYDALDEARARQQVLPP